MSSEPRLRLRCIAPVALCAVLCSSPAFAALLCPYSLPCPIKARNLEITSAATAHDSIATSKSCCPVHKRKPMVPNAPFDCCVQGPADFLLQAAFSPGPALRLIALRSDVIDWLPAASHVPPAGFEAAFVFVKPVEQKKTDLRI